MVSQFGSNLKSYRFEAHHTYKSAVMSLPHRDGPAKGMLAASCHSVAFGNSAL